MKSTKIFILLLFTTSNLMAQSFYGYCEANGKKIAPSYQQVNCVQFMDEALKNYISIPKEVSKLIYINYSMDRIKEALKTKDTTILGGVCFALTKFGYADWISYNNIKKGDIVQYWSSVGFVNGHCGVFSGFDSNGMLLLGSHPDTEGYGTMNVNDKNIECLFWIVRLK